MLWPLCPLWLVSGKGSFCCGELPGGVRIAVIPVSKYLLCILDLAQIDWGGRFLLNLSYVCAGMSRVVS